MYNRPGTEAERGNKVCTFVGGQQYPSDLFLTSLGCGYVYNRPGTEAEMANKVCTFVGGEQYPSDLFLTSLGCGYMCNPPGTEAERGNKVCSFWWVKNILRSFPLTYNRVNQAFYTKTIRNAQEMLSGLLS